MDKVKQDKLMDDFPLLYADRNKSSRYSLMCFGFECFNGWYDIIYDLSSKLEPMIQKWIDENPGKDYPRAIQVKEKFGTLRFYMTHATTEMYNAISEAEKKTETTCEACGKPGKLRGGGWVFTFCDECDEKKKTGWRPCDDEVR